MSEDHTLTGEKALEAMAHLMGPPVGGRPAVVEHDGKRYGGFRDANHAAFFVREKGLTGAVIRDQRPDEK